MINFSRQINRYYFLGLIVVFVIFGCKKNKNTQIPHVPVNITINTTLPQYINIASPGGWIYLNGGSKGIILYRKTSSEFLAYDRHCTYNIDNPCGSASVDSTNITIVCSCDGSKYSIYDGYATQGPAEIPLHQYQTSFDGTNVRVYN